MKLIQGNNKLHFTILLYSIDLVKKRKYYQIISLIFIVLDLIVFCMMEILDISYTLKTEDYSLKLVVFIIKV